MGKPSEEAARPAKAVPWATQGAAKDRRAWIHSVCVKKKRPGKDNGKAHSVTKARVGWKGRRTRHRRTDKDVGLAAGAAVLLWRHAPPYPSFSPLACRNSFGS